ncbi:MAG: putative guanine nucleotide exchange factor, partial [Streblomastix strix]
MFTLKLPHVPDLIISLQDISPEEVARQLTLIEAELFFAVQPIEFVGAAWTKTKGIDLAPNLRKMTNRFNYMVDSVSTYILSKGSPQQRADAIIYLTRVFSAFEKIGNFNGMMEIAMGTVWDVPIKRLPATHAILKQHQKELERIKTITDINGKHRVLRQMIKVQKIPFIPFFTMYLTDVVHDDEMHTIIERQTEICDIYHIADQIILHSEDRSEIQDQQQQNQFTTLRLINVEKLKNTYNIIDIIKKSRTIPF